MHIGFDFRPATRKNSRTRGIGRHTVGILKALLDQPSPHRVSAFIDRGTQVDWIPQTVPTPYLRSPSRLHWLTDRILLPGIIKRSGVDLFQATDVVSVPRVDGVQSWAFVHDLIPLMFWDQMRDRLPADYAYALKRAFRKLPEIDHIVTGSEYSRGDICRRLGISGEKVHVVYYGCDDHLEPQPKEEASRKLRAKFGLEQPFLFYVGGSDYRKNLLWLIREFDTIRRHGYQGTLVLAGETFLFDIEEVREVRREVAEHHLDDFVVFPGYVPGADLSDFYSACDFFVFPSLCEGFGIPVLEALKCGAPVLTSHRSAIPEVAADCAHYFDPEEKGAMASAFLEARSDAEGTEAMRRRGLTRAGGFSWNRAGRELLALYERFGPE